MNPKALMAVGVTIVALGAGTALLQQSDPKPPAFMYLLDARRDSNTPLEQALPVIKKLEQKYTVKVIVRTAASPHQLRDYPSVFEEFDRTRIAIEPLPMFFALERPYKNTMKDLRSAIESRASLHRANRAQLMRRLIVVRDTEKLIEPHECRQLRDDMIYVRDNYMGIGLTVHDGTLQDLKKCIDVSAPAL